MKFLLDFFPALAFFAAYLLSDIYTATIALIVSLFLVVAAYWLWKRELHKAHAITAGVALVLGGLTLYLRDPEFIKIKPTLVYTVFALALLGSHFFGPMPLLQRMGRNALPLPDPVWRRVNLAWVGFFAACAVLNFYVAHNYDESTWVKFKTFGFTALTFVFLLAHAPFVSRYLQDPPGERGA